MLPVKKIPVSTPKWLRAYASTLASLLLIQSMYKECLSLVPKPIRRCVKFVLPLLFGFIKRRLPSSIRRFLSSVSRKFFKPGEDGNLMTLQIEEYQGMLKNEIYTASEQYLQNNTSTSTRILKIAQTRRDTTSSYHFAESQEFEDMYEGIELKWLFKCESKKRCFEIEFDVEHKEKVKDSYLPYVLERVKAMKAETKVVKLHTLRIDKVGWDAINFEHFATFETLAMDLKLKREVIEDLDRFLEGKEFHKRVGRAWKRGYLLYGPPGTGKSSLIAAMANYLKFDVYDLQLTHLKSDMELRRVLLATNNRSILVIEDIDCSLEVQNRKLTKSKIGERKEPEEDQMLTLSGLLNFTDGLWSSCGEERIFVFTTNHKNKLDPALLRPGRMDMHIHMSYCTYEGFKTLARNYLGIYEDHPMFEEVESLLKNARVTPAQVAEELRKSTDAEVALQGLITLLKP